MLTTSELNMISLSKKRSGNARSKMLKMIMPYLSRENGEQLAEAIDKKKAGQFKAVWDKIKRDIGERLQSSHSSAEGKTGHDRFEGVTLEKVDATFAALFTTHIGEINMLETLGEDLAAEASVNQAEAELMNGQSAEKTKLRQLLAFGSLLLENGVVLRLVSIETLSGTKYGSVLPLQYKISLQAYDLENEHAIKTFVQTGHLASTVYDMLLIAESYLKKS